MNDMNVMKRTFISKLFSYASPSLLLITQKYPSETEEPDSKCLANLLNDNNGGLQFLER